VHAIVANDVWKSYPRWTPGTRSLRSMLSPSMRAGRRSAELRWALRDVSFSLDAGNALGVIGHNGAGKSTLLRLASGLGQPTRGGIRVSSNSASVLSLGDTFSSELTGRENAITAAVVAGLSTSDAEAALPAILDFAELEGFEEAPIRSYSDGMKLRLAFGVVTVLTPDLLVLDEVLAVGDIGFQEKCMAHLHGLRDRGTALLFASHDLGQIAEDCESCLWLDGGRVRAHGDAGEVVEEYRAAMRDATLASTPALHVDDSDDRLVLQQNRFGSQEARIETVSLGPVGVESGIRTGDPLEVTLSVATAGGKEPMVISVAVSMADQDVICLTLTSDLDETTLAPDADGRARVTLEIDNLDLMPGRYFVDVGLFPIDYRHAYDFHWHAYPLLIRGESHADEGFYRPRQRRWIVEGA
jgi:lipopolysaccharide transport system ATP-binding protein